jgi:hypothetical protein
MVCARFLDAIPGHIHCCLHWRHFIEHAPFISFKMATSPKLVLVCVDFENEACSLTLRPLS